MAIENNLIHFKNKENFDNEVANGNILDHSIVFIQDSKEISTHGTVYKTVNWSVLLPPRLDLSLFDIYGNPIDQTTANCYVIKNTGDYKFPLVYGNALKSGVTNSAAYTKIAGNYSMDFVNHKGTVITDPWIKNNGYTPQNAFISMSDTDGAISDLKVENDYCYFTVNSVPDVGGNVVISVTDSNNGLLWNWHIWLWKDSLDVITIINNGGNEYNILPVNLASKWDTGKSTIKNWFYQWGRSVPMLCPSTYNSTTDHANYGEREFSKNRLASSYRIGITTPQNFYYTTIDTSDWFLGSSYYNLWDANCTSTGNLDNAIIKTIYDPCPIGFTIPNGNTFVGVSTEMFFPYSGYRIYASGSLANVGSVGYVWLSSSASQDDAFCLYISNDKFSRIYNPRACGLSVRPVQEQN